MPPKILVITVGVGQTIVDGISRSVETQNPDSVIFLCTKESREKHDEKIRQRITTENKFVILSNPSDADRLVLECARIIASEQERGKVVVDFTTGTKAMSAALYAAALVLDVETACYVEGERNDHGLVISGTERVKTLRNTIPRAILSSGRAVKLYNSHFYGGALEIAKEIRNEVSRIEDMKAKAEALYLVCELAYRWDNFDFAEAAEVLKKGITESVLRAIGEMLGFGDREDVVGEKIKSLGEYVEKLNEPLNPYLAWELLRNAERRAKTGRFDDAVGRLYRTIEYVGQLRLSQRGLFDGENFKRNETVSLPEDLKERLDRNVPIGLKDLFRYLSYLKDHIAETVIKNDDLTAEFQETLSARNKSVLAHGFKPVGKENYEKLLGLAKSLIKKAEIDKPGFDILPIKKKEALL